MSFTVDIYFDKLLRKLLCWYAFFIPLERILEVFFDIETIFKPYRVFALLILFVFMVRSRVRWKKNEEITQDIFLYLIFAYGILVTIFALITTPFNLAYFLNDAFQIGLYLGVFLVIRHLHMSASDMLNILKWLFAGVVLNSLFVFNSFYILQNYLREGGLMDNPNYLALSLIFALCFLVIQLPNVRSNRSRLLWLATFSFLGYIFILAGSRTGLAILSIAFVIILLTSPLKIKSRFIAMAVVILVLLNFGGASLIRNSGPLYLLNRINKEYTRDNRVDIWKGVIEASKQSNFAGLGIGQFKARFSEFYHDVNNPLITRILQRNYFLSPHSDYLSFLVVYGIVGLMGYLIFLYLSLRKIWISFVAATDSLFKQHYQLCLILLTSLALFGITQESLISPIFWILLAVSTRVVFEPEWSESTQQNINHNLI